MTVGAKNNYTRAIKLDLTFFSFGFYIFEVFCSLLNSRRRLEDVQTETNRSERVDNNHLCLRVLGMLSLSIRRFWGKGENGSEKGREVKERNPDTDAFNGVFHPHTA